VFSRTVPPSYKSIGDVLTTGKEVGLCVWEHSRNIQGTFREHSGDFQGPFRGHSGSIQGTFRKHSGNIQGRLDFALNYIVANASIWPHTLTFNFEPGARRERGPRTSSIYNNNSIRNRVAGSAKGRLEIVKNSPIMSPGAFAKNRNGSLRTQ
jgi:hypothetical protein